MIPIKARVIFETSLEAIGTLERGMYAVECEDGVVVECKHTHIIFDRHIWELFKLYPNTPITSECLSRVLLGNGYFNGNTHIRMLERITEHISNTHGLVTYKQREPLIHTCYIVYNNIHNQIVQAAGSRCTTIDAVDFVKLVNTEQIKSVSENIKPTPESVDNAYANIRSYVNNKESTNRVVDAYRSGSVNDNQANQCIGPRGFVSDMDRTVFKQPILSGFIRGMLTLYEIAAESLSAGKALNASDVHIAMSEYASRKGQIQTMYVTHIVPGDCGTDKTTTVSMSEKYLLNMRGKWYKDPSTGKLKVLRAKDKHLIDTLVEVRTSLGCLYQFNSKICATCIGDLSNNFKANSNVGYTMMSYLMEKISQGILSTKHLINSVKKAVIKLDGEGPKYFISDQDNNLYFHQDLSLKGLQMVLPNNKVSKLVDVLNLEHTNVALNKIGELEQVLIRNINGKIVTQKTVSVSYRDRNSIITRDLLEFIKNSNEVQTDPRGNFVISLDKWDKSKPVLYNPLKEVNLVSFVHKFSSVIETNSAKFSDPYEKLFYVFDMVNEQFNCNISVIEPMIYAGCAANSAAGDYRMPRNSPTMTVENAKSDLMKRRSLSAYMASEDQMDGLINRPEVVFAKGPRQNHPMDVLFVPSQEVNKHFVE